MFHCQECKISFTYKNQYSIHQALSHGEREQYVCICGKGYTYKSSLNRHRKKCTTRGSYICGKCNSILSDIHNGRLHEAACGVKRIKLGEPSRQELLALKSGSDGITPYETAFGGRLASYFIRSPYCMDLITFLEHTRTNVADIIMKAVVKHSSIKYNLWADCTFKNLHGEEMVKALKTRNRAIYLENDINPLLDKDFCKLKRELEEAAMSKSGWSLISIDGLRVRVSKHNPLRASTYIPLPKSIANKKACVNVKNNDNRCFVYAILAKFIDGDHANRSSKYKTLETKYNFSCINFPTHLKDVKTFESINNISINIFGLDENEQIYPLKVVNDELDDHRDLLLLNSENIYHYIYIKDFSKLVGKQISNHQHSKFICKRCFTYFNKRYDGEARYLDHKQLCNTHKPARVKLPIKKPYVEFEHAGYIQRVPVVIYLDFETILEPVDTCRHDPEKSYTITSHQHTPMSFGVYVKISDEVKAVEHNLPTEPYIYRGSNAAKHCVLYLKKIAELVSDLYNVTIPINTLSPQEEEDYLNATICYMCEKPFTDKDVKVRDHSHISGVYRGPAHSVCNLQCKKLNFLPVFCHNLSGYDSHFLIRELGYDDNEITVIPTNGEQYISFTKAVTDQMKLRFVDSFRFMASSLDRLAKNLTHLVETAKFFNPNVLHLVCRKGVFPYEYVSCWDKLQETSLPPREAFYSTLKGGGINEDDYQHALNVWDTFSCNTLGDYSDLYLKIDVLLLSDIFERFRTVTIQSHKLDPAHYFTLPGLSWDAMLRHTKCRLELLTDYDQILMIESGIRGGICQVSHRYAEANNKYMKDYNPLLPSTFITYQDCNNLYGYAMSKYLPYGGFKWVDPESVDLASLDEFDELGYIFDADIDYPDNLHNAHNDLPFLAENIKIDGQIKLSTHFHPRKNYVCHYMILKQAVKHGLHIVRVNRVLQFKQSPWLATYIEHNTKLRKRATNEFEKDLYKLFNNSVFGKTMENIRNRISLKLVSNPTKLEKLIARPDCLDWVIYDQTLAAIHLAKSSVFFCKPTFIGLSVLDLSKFHTFFYHFEVMIPFYGPKIQLCYTDTDSFIYLITTEDLFDDMLQLSHYLDLSNYPPDHRCHSEQFKKTVGKFKDEAAGKIITEFIGLRPKMYALQLGDNEIIKKAKGVKKDVLSRSIEFNDYVACLLSNECIRNSMIMFRSKQHKMITIEQNRISLCPWDNKRCILTDSISTRALGHFLNSDK